MVLLRGLSLGCTRANDSRNLVVVVVVGLIVRGGVVWVR